MRKSGLGLALLFSLIAPIKAVYAEAIMISGKLQADLPAVSFDPGPGDFVAYVNSNTITASGAGTACNVTVDDRATSSVDNLVFLSGYPIPWDLLLTVSLFQAFPTPPVI